MEREVKYTLTTSLETNQDIPVMNLTADAIERTFERLCTIAQGKSASADALPESVEFAATLLILREFMHHMGLPSITILP